jgi:hypothetical protein
MMDFYAELFPFLVQLHKNEFQMTATSFSITVDESSCPTLKLLDSLQTLVFHKLVQSATSESNSMADFYEIVKPIYEALESSLKSESLTGYIDHLDLYSHRTSPVNLIRFRRRNLMLSLHCLCLLLRYSKQQQSQFKPSIQSEICTCLRPVLLDFVLKVTQFSNQLYDPQANTHYEQIKTNLAYSESERQLYLGTYESNNVAKATIPSM